jgi:hypothetical protein
MQPLAPVRLAITGRLDPLVAISFLWRDHTTAGLCFGAFICQRNIIGGIRVLKFREAKMKKLALILLAAASLVGAAGVASAQYGGGYYSGGPGPYYGDRYRERYYDDDGRYYGRRYYRRGYGYPVAACYYVYGRRICCPGGFTVQDGVCKPYRGY